MPITDTEDRLIARLAIIGDSNRPNTGYRTPAASGTPRCCDNSGHMWRKCAPSLQETDASAALPRPPRPPWAIRRRASEPDVAKPVAMAWDERGRLWIAENYTYAERTQRFDLALRDRAAPRPEHGYGKPPATPQSRSARKLWT